MLIVQLLALLHLLKPIFWNISVLEAARHYWNGLSEDKKSISFPSYFNG
jgi:hypothetical protein